MLRLKGSPSSGWYAPPKGTHSQERHVSVGSGKSGKGSVAKLQTLASKTGKRVAIYSLSKGQRLPDYVLNSTNVPIIVGKQGLIASTSGESHAVVASAVGIYGEEFDSYARFRLDRGKLYANSATMGGVDFNIRTDAEYDAAVEKVMLRAMPALVAAGIPLDKTFEWTTLG
jgi:hypothetical protein